MTKSKILTWGGLLLIAAALLCTGYNLADSRRAERAAQAALEQVESAAAASASEKEPMEEAPEIPAYVLDPEMEMPEVEADGWAYVAALEIPALKLTLPVISRWSYPALRQAPCRYTGSAYRNDLIIAGHNYDRHFGGLKNLSVGDEIHLTDMDGNRFDYAVSAVEQLPGTAVEEMEAGDWDLTLFTCTIGGRARVTVRCVRTDTAGAAS